MIFYFSATGNTKKLACEIARRLNEKTTDIESIPKEGEFRYEMDDGETVGFLFPVYFCNVPDIFLDFIKRLRLKSNERYYAFAAGTYGTQFGAAMIYAIKALLAQGITINASFALKTIDTFLPMFSIPEGDDRAAVENAANLQTDIICQKLRNRSAGRFEPQTSFRRTLSAMMGITYRIMNKTSFFRIAGACSGCGLCADRCPIGAIEMSPGNRPHWTVKRCMLCLRCVHGCPADAIEYSRLTDGKTRFKQN